MNKIFELGGMILVGLILGYLLFHSTGLLGSSTGYNSLALTPSASLGDSDAISNSSLTIGGGTAITAYKCATATFNPGSLATSTITNATTTDIALTGAVTGDTCSASLDSATSSAIAVACNITGNATATLRVSNLGTTNAAIDIATGTAKVCYTH